MKLTKEEEIKFIKENRPELTYQKISEHLNRSISYVYGLAKQAGAIEPKSPDLEGEEWRQAPGLTNYLISNFGRIKNKDRQRTLKLRVHEGYYDVRITDLGQKKTVRPHRLVALAFLEQPSEKHIVNHKDGNKLNNHVDNLEWVTYKENLRHAIDAGVYDDVNKGVAILTEKEVREICELIVDGKSYAEIEKHNPRYKRSRVEGIRQRRNWTHITKDCSW